jgi:hypothetical protein
MKHKGREYRIARIVVGTLLIVGSFVGLAFGRPTYIAQVIAVIVLGIVLVIWGCWGREGRAGMKGRT